MKVYDAIKKRRTIRKFTQKPIPKETLLSLVDCARMAPYGANLQPLKFAILDEPSLLETVFPCTKWAGYLKNGTPTPQERPTAYLLLLGDTTIKKNGDFQVETGAAGMAITLAATASGLGACWIGALDRKQIRELLQIPEHLTVLDIIALGYPAQESEAVPIQQNDVKYYLNEADILQVPKRSLEEVLYSI